MERPGPINLEAGDRARILHDAARAGVSGGTVYDYLISRCALRAEVKPGGEADVAEELGDLGGGGGVA